MRNSPDRNRKAGLVHAPPADPGAECGYRQPTADQPVTTLFHIEREVEKTGAEEDDAGAQQGGRVILAARTRWPHDRAAHGTDVAGFSGISIRRELENCRGITTRTSKPGYRIRNGVVLTRRILLRTWQFRYRRG